MWASPPARIMSTLTVRGSKGLPRRAEWGHGASSNISTRIPHPQGEYAWWTYIPTSGPLPVHSRWLCTQGLSPHGILTPTSPTHLTREHPPRAKSHISMTAKVQELLSHAVLDTSSQAMGSATLKRPTYVALGAPSSSRAEDSSKPVAISCQASPQVAMPDTTEPIDQTPEVACAPTTLPAKTPRDDTNALSRNVILLQEEMNRAMGHVLMTRSSLGTHQQKEVLDFKMALCWNKAEATEAIKEAKAHCGASIREAESHCTTSIREAEADHASIIMEAEAHCTGDIRKSRVPLCRTCPFHPTIACRGYATSGNGSQGRGGKRPPLLPNHTWNGTAGLPPGVHGVLMGPFHLLTGNMPLATLLNIPP